MSQVCSDDAVSFAGVIKSMESLGKSLEDLRRTSEFQTAEIILLKDERDKLEAELKSVRMQHDSVVAHNMELQMEVEALQCDLHDKESCITGLKHVLECADDCNIESKMNVVSHKTVLMKGLDGNVEDFKPAKKEKSVRNRDFLNAHHSVWNEDLKEKLKNKDFDAQKALVQDFYTHVFSNNGLDETDIQITPKFNHQRRHWFVQLRVMNEHIMKDLEAHGCRRFYVDDESHEYVNIVKTRE